MSITRPLSSALFLLTSLTCHALLADQAVISDDGREVLIRDDGSWEFRSEDRFANTKDGRRIRLKADGSWVYVGNAPLVTKEQARSTIVDLRLQKIEIEYHKEKVHKNTRTERQTVFYINVDVSPLAKQGLRVADTSLDSIIVMDDKGNKYPILSITPDNIEVAPKSNQTFVLRAKDAPTLWDGAELMEIQLPATILGNPEPVTFSRKLYDIEQVRVEKFKKQ